MVSTYNQEIIRRTLSLLGVTMLELFKRAKAAEEPGQNSHHTETGARRDYNRFKDGIYPRYLIRYCEKMLLKDVSADVRNLAARLGGIEELKPRTKRNGKT